MRGTQSKRSVIALIALSALDAGSFLLASEPYAGAWWASLTLLAGQFAVPAVGDVCMLDVIGADDTIERVG